jgi:hypothetical protein
MATTQRPTTADGWTPQLLRAEAERLGQGTEYGGSMHSLMLFAGSVLLGFGLMFLFWVVIDYLTGCWFYRHHPLKTPGDMIDFDFAHERSTTFWRPLTRVRLQRLLVSLAAMSVGGVLLWAASRF